MPRIRPIDDQRASRVLVHRILTKNGNTVLAERVEDEFLGATTHAGLIRPQLN